MYLKIQPDKNHNGRQYHSCTIVNIREEDEVLIKSWKNWLKARKNLEDHDLASKPNFVDFTSRIITIEIRTENWAYEPAGKDWPYHFLVKQIQEPFRLILRERSFLL